LIYPLIYRRAFLLTPLALLAHVRAAERKPNIVLILARGWRGQAAPWMDDPDLQAPQLKKFGEGALVFPRAYTASPSPGPARAAIMTGRFPHSNGAIKDGVAMRTEEVTLSAVLAVAGYHAVSSLEKDSLEKAAAPFFATVTLDPPRFSKAADSAAMHVPRNIPPDVKNARADLASYYGMLADLDQQLGKALAAAPNDALIVFTSDCGAEIGSHGIAGNDVAFEESVRVPLAIRFPGVIAPGVSDLLVSHVDIFPTLLTLCGEPAFEGIQGRDLAPFLTGGNGDRPEWVFVEGKLGDHEGWRMLVEGMDKIIVDAAGDVLGMYNLAADPFEMTNRAEDPTQQLKRDQLLAVMRTARSKFIDFRRR
jgi:arylsulfatase A-like enzyme